MTLENQTTANENQTTLADKANEANLANEMNEATGGNGLLNINANNDTSNEQGSNDEDIYAKFMNEDGSFNREYAEEFMNAKNSEIESVNKQRDDMRRIISKNKAVSSADDYMKTFKVENESLERLLDFSNENNAELQQGINEFTKELYDNGVSEAHGHVMINKMLMSYKPELLIFAE